MKIDNKEEENIKDNKNNMADGRWKDRRSRVGKKEEKEEEEEEEEE